MQQKLVEIAADRLIRNCYKILLQIATAHLLQIATSLLEIAIDITNWDKYFTNCDNYYKLQRLLQIARKQFQPDFQIPRTNTTLEGIESVRSSNLEEYIY